MAKTNPMFATGRPGAAPVLVELDGAEDEAEEEDDPVATVLVSMEELTGADDVDGTGTVDNGEGTEDDELSFGDVEDAGAGALDKTGAPVVDALETVGIGTSEAGEVAMTGTSDVSEAVAVTVSVGKPSPTRKVPTWGILTNFGPLGFMIARLDTSLDSVAVTADVSMQAIAMTATED